MTISRDALERVLSRATELQSPGVDVPERITEERLLEIAREVGIDPVNLRQAVAEERLRGPETAAERGALLEALGPRHVAAQRVVPGTPAEVLQRLDHWLPRMELLTPQRRLADRAVWEPRRDFMGNLLRSFGMAGRRQDLVRVDEVHVSATPVDGGRSVVRFDVHLTRTRRAQRALFLGLGVGLNVLAFGVFSLPLLFLSALSEGAPAFAAGALGVLATVQTGVAWLMWRSLRSGYRQVVERAQLRLEQLLDDLERGGLQVPESLLGQMRTALLTAAGTAGKPTGG